MAADDGDERSAATPRLEQFLGEPTRDLAAWAWLWEGDHTFPVASHRGLAGRLFVFLKRLFRPLVKAPVNDLWDRQRTFNLILLETLQKELARHQAQHDELHRHVQHIHQDFQAAIEAHAGRLETLDARTTMGLNEVMRHNDALFARVDQKLDRYRREAKELWGRLGALIAAGSGGETSVAAMAPTQKEQSYLELERRYRGAEDEIADRIAAYLPHLEGRSPILDLGCGRGEALKLFAAHGLTARGVDGSRAMVERCCGQGLQVEEGDLFAHLAAVDEGSLGAVVSFHVIEHLPPDSLERLVRLAWRALRAGGMLILETPSPLSVVMAARNFWVDPTHLRPVHPASLEVWFREAGFEPVHRMDLHPFPDDERLPEIDLSSFTGEQQALADDVNRLRDRLDDLLFGSRDFAMLGVKP